VTAPCKPPKKNKSFVFRQRNVTVGRRKVSGHFGRARLFCPREWNENEGTGKVQFVQFVRVVGESSDERLRSKTGNWLDAAKSSGKAPSRVRKACSRTRHPAQARLGRAIARNRPCTSRSDLIHGPIEQLGNRTGVWAPAEGRGRRLPRTPACQWPAQIQRGAARANSGRSTPQCGGGSETKIAFPTD